MNVLIAPDKFKGTLTAEEVCNTLSRGLLRSGVDATIKEFPLADGGEGTLEVFLFHSGGKRISVEVHDPLMRKITAEYGISNDGKTAFIEMARASGLGLLLPQERNPLKTTSFGTGELIKHALDRNVEKIILGIGGSATNDAALGAAVALGTKVLDKEGTSIFPTGENLGLIEEIDVKDIHPRLKSVNITAICDVTNPFFGSDGAAYTYAAQKGASEKDIQVLDDGLQQIARVIKKRSGVELNDISGSGAGGGFAGGCFVLFQATLQRGAEVILDLSDFNAALAWADVVITGEGKVDHQTLQGKLVETVSRRASGLGKPVLVVCGVSELDPTEWSRLSLKSVYSLVDFAGKEMALHHSEAALEALAFEKISKALQAL